MEIAGSTSEIVLRSLCRKLSRQHTGVVAGAAVSFHAKYSRQTSLEPDWETLLSDLIDSPTNKIIIVMDALDERSNYEELLECLARILQVRKNVFVLCSSREHVQVSGHLDGGVLEIETSTSKSTLDMDIFVDTTIAQKKA